MKKIKKSLINAALLATILMVSISCDKEFATIGSGILGSNNFETNSVIYPLITYNQDIGPLQSNGLPAHLLGYSNDAVFGDFTASFVAQMTPSAYDPVFGENVVLDSVVLSIPYFSRPIDTDEEGNNTYELDSIFGDTPIKLSVYKNNYFLRNFNPELEFNEDLKYFTNKTTSDGNIIGASDLEGALLYENIEFLPSSDQIILTTFNEDTEEDEISERLVPAIRVHLDNPMNLWETTIFEKEGEPELSNESNFIDHFRGLYIKAEAMDVNGTMMLLNFSSNSTLTLYYTSDIPSDDDGGDSETETAPGTFVLNFSGNQVNFFEDNFINIPDGNQDDGDEILYLKGAEGSMAIINLFNGDEDGNSPELDDFKSQNWLINQAELIFYVDQNTVQGEEPDRIFLYDLNTNTALIDYFIDQSVSSTQVNAKIDHLQPLVRVDDEPNGEGIKYKIEITEHINNIFLRDSTNAKLGLVVTTNVNTIDALDLQNEGDPLEKSVSGSFLSTRGTVLHGNNAPDEEKRVKLKIYYTEPDN